MAQTRKQPGAEVHGEKSQHSQDHEEQHDGGRGRKPIAIRFGGSIRDDSGIDAVLCSQSIFRHQSVFIHSQKMRHRADESAIEDASRQLIPLLIFQGFQIFRRDARGRGDLLERYAAHFAFAF